MGGRGQSTHRLQSPTFTPRRYYFVFGEIWKAYSIMSYSRRNSHNRSLPTITHQLEISWSERNHLLIKEVTKWFWFTTTFVHSKAIKAIFSLDWEILLHAAYSLDMASSNYHLFRSLQQCLADTYFKISENASITLLPRSRQILWSKFA